MGLADALSQKDEVDTSDNNWEIILLKEEDHDHYCYGTRSWTCSFHCTFTAVNC